MFLKKAMRYYRLWIYTCNFVLLAAVVAMIVVAICTISHPYFRLLPSPPAYDPTFLYAYVALMLQAGFVQALGCLGARRLSKKLLHWYWISLFLLLVGDASVGIIWFLRFPKLDNQLLVTMNSTMHSYGVDETFTHSWNKLQEWEECCGINSSEDFATTKLGKIPNSCCYKTRRRLNNSQQMVRHVPYNRITIHSETSSTQKVLKCPDGYQPYDRGCDLVLRTWMRSSTEALMILGFCVITFIKFCFVGILKFEITEMIEKIKVLQSDPANSANPELAAALGLILPGAQSENDILKEDSDSVNRNTNLSGSRTLGDLESQFTQTNFTGNGKASIGIKEDRIEVNKQPLISPMIQMRANAADTEQDSDTNSNSALITGTPVHRIRDTNSNTADLLSSDHPLLSSNHPFINRSDGKNDIPMHRNTDKLRYNGNNNELTANSCNPKSSADSMTTHENNTNFSVRQTQI